MQKIFVNPITFQCHVFQNNNGTLIPYETDFFKDKCETFIEGYRFIPSGTKWTRKDGTVFTGEMIAPWKPYDELDAAQREYEQQLLLDYQTENTELKAQQNELITSYNEGVNSI